MEKRRKWTEEEINEVINLYTKEKLSCFTIGQKYNITRGPINKLLLDNNVKLKNRLIKEDLTREEIDDIKYRYFNTSEQLKSIRESYKMSAATFRRLTNQAGITTRNKRKPCMVNENYFQAIDTENKAYFLGLLSADGYIIDCKKGQYRVGISLQEKDVEILYAMKNDMNFDGKILYRKKRNKNWQATYSIQISSNKMANDLISLGVTPRKSLNLEYPTINQIPEIFMRDYIRGLFDGDGCITSGLNKGKINFRFFIVGALGTCDGVKNILFSKLGLGSGNVTKKELNDGVRRPIYYYYVTGNHAIRKLYDYLYSDSSCFLTRKELKFREIFSYN